MRRLLIATILIVGICLGACCKSNPCGSCFCETSATAASRVPLVNRERGER